MAGRLVEAEAAATKTLELGMQIGAPDAFTLFAGEFFAIGTFAGRHEELFPLVEQATKDDPPGPRVQARVRHHLHHGIGRDQTGAILDDGMASGSRDCPSTTSGQPA